MRGLDSTWKSAGAGCEMGKGALEQGGRGEVGGMQSRPPMGCERVISGRATF